MVARACLPLFVRNETLRRVLLGLIPVERVLQARSNCSGQVGRPASSRPVGLPPSGFTAFFTYTFVAL